MTIRGTTYTPDPHRRLPTVVFLHGFTGQRTEAGFMFVHLARALSERSIAAVTFDFLHSGESDGSFENMLPTGELADALRVTEWVQGQSFADRSRMALLGFSLGGLLAASTIARTDAYKALILIAPSTVENISRLAREERVNGWVTKGPHIIHPDFIDDVSKLEPTVDVIRNPMPTLYIQGTNDIAVPPEVSQKYVDAIQNTGGPLTTRIMEDANHIFNTPHWRAELNQTVADWAVEQLCL